MLHEEDDGRLAPILSAIDTLGNSMLNDLPKLARLFDYMFSDIEKYVSHPSISYGCFSICCQTATTGSLHQSSGVRVFQKLRRRGLKYVDEYYLDYPEEHKLFDASRGYEWRFIFYQWSLSMRTSPSTTESFYGAAARFKRVNDYVFMLWNEDHKLAYKSIRNNFWRTRWSSEQNKTWQVDAQELAPYDNQKLIELATVLSNSQSISNVQRAQMSEFVLKVQAVAA